MGSVFLARDPAIDRYVAIKLMRSGFDDSQLRERFQREARSVGRLHHANIVTVFDVGEHNGEPFIAMEYVEGQTLGHLIRHPDRAPFETRLDWIEAICAGLSYAHKSGIIHRDIKPANVMVDNDGGLKILDFGIARATSGSGTQTATQAGTVLGTLNYMSPEQLSGRPVDHRTDIFSAGALFYELLSGRMAFPGDIQSGVLHYILVTGPREPLLDACPTLHPRVAAIVDRCLARDVDARYADFGAVRRDLTTVRSELRSASGATPTVVIARDDAPRPPSSGGGRSPRTPSAGTRAELLKLRGERLSELLGDARTAIEREDLAAARDHCRQALIIDPEYQPALELQDRVDAVARAHEWLSQAQQELAGGQLTSAASLAERVLSVLPDSAGAAAVRRGVEDARRRLEEIAERARRLEATLGEGRAHLAAGRLDEAAQAAAAAIGIDGASAEARSLQQQAIAGLEARRRAESEARARRAIAQVQELVAQARERFAAGDHEGALGMLRAHQPRHVLVTEAIAALEQDLAEQARLAEEARRAEAARLEAEARRRDEEARERREAERREEDARRRAEAEAQRIAEAEERRQARAAEQTAKEERKRRRAAERAVAKEREMPLAPPPADPRTSARPRWVLPAAGGVVVMVAAVWWFSSRPSAPTPAALPAVSVLLDVRPWATIDRVTRASDGQAVDLACPSTPCLVSLPPGTYHVRAANPFFAALEFDFTVGGDGPSEVRRSFASFSPDDEARKALEGR